jgi:hypothetical protein
MGQITLDQFDAVINRSSTIFEFFKGRRRKAGCVTLVMSCAALGLWVCGQNADGIVGYSLIGSRLIIANDPDRVVIWLWNEAEVEANAKSTSAMINWGEVPLPNDIAGIDAWFLRCEVARAVLYSQVRHCELFHWAVTWPLTLASAFLLLWPSRRRSEPNAPTKSGQ